NHRVKGDAFTVPALRYLSCRRPWTFGFRLATVGHSGLESMGESVIAGQALVSPERWTAEQAFTGLGRSHRPRKDDEWNSKWNEALIHVAVMVRTSAGPIASIDVVRHLTSGFLTMRARTRMPMSRMGSTRGCASGGSGAVQFDEA